MRRNPFLLSLSIFVFAVVGLMASSAFAQQKQINLRTHYAAPLGGYRQMRLVPTDTDGDAANPFTINATACNANTTGTIFMADGDTNDAYDDFQLYVCREDSSGVISWQLASSGIWERAGNNVYPRDWDVVNVGIGTSDPKNTLTVWETNTNQQPGSMIGGGNFAVEVCQECNNIPTVFSCDQVRAGTAVCPSGQICTLTAPILCSRDYNPAVVVGKVGNWGNVQGQMGLFSYAVNSGAYSVDAQGRLQINGNTVAIPWPADQIAIMGVSNSAGVYGISVGDHPGVVGYSEGQFGVHGIVPDGAQAAVMGEAKGSSVGVLGHSKGAGTAVSAINFGSGLSLSAWKPNGSAGTVADINFVGTSDLTDDNYGLNVYVADAVAIRANADGGNPAILATNASFAEWNYFLGKRGKYGTISAYTIGNGVPALLAWSDNQNVVTESALLYGVVKQKAIANRLGIILQTEDNTFDQGVAFQNSGNFYTWHIFRKQEIDNTARLVIAGGNTNANLENLTERMTVYSSGNVGIGTTHASGGFAKLEVEGGVKVGDDTGVCTTDREGTMRYSKAQHRTEVCQCSEASGTCAWRPLGGQGRLRCVPVVKSSVPVAADADGFATCDAYASSIGQDPNDWECVVGAENATGGGYVRTCDIPDKDVKKFMCCTIE